MVQKQGDTSWLARMNRVINSSPCRRAEFQQPLFSATDTPAALVHEHCLLSNNPRVASCFAGQLRGGCPCTLLGQPRERLLLQVTPVCTNPLKTQIRLRLGDRPCAGASSFQPGSLGDVPRVYTLSWAQRDATAAKELRFSKQERGFL